MIRNLSIIDTTPGAGWAAPEAQVADYTAWLRDRFRADPGVRQYMFVAARLKPVAVSGPYAEPFRAALAAMSAFFS